MRAPSRWAQFWDLWRWCEGGPCSIQWTFFGVAREGSRTMYYWNGQGRNPNRDVFLCRSCAADHHEYWDDRWSEYYGGLM